MSKVDGKADKKCSFLNPHGTLAGYIPVGVTMVVPSRLRLLGWYLLL
jgi:hypothetical protein